MNLVISCALICVTYFLVCWILWRFLNLGNKKKPNVQPATTRTITFKPKYIPPVVNYSPELLGRLCDHLDAIKAELKLADLHGKKATRRGGILVDVRGLEDGSREFSISGNLTIRVPASSVPGFKRCYQCSAEVAYLFPDRRCSKCTRDNVTEADREAKPRGGNPTDGFLGE